MSSLARHYRNNATAEDLEAMRRRAWRQQGVIVHRPEEIRDTWLKQVLIEEAVKRYGPMTESGR